ncbi:MAG TPA: SRPBCC family protein [Rhizomicrobium sp.]|nr:SRPBCC family protein [Rhizomicrobium sp.]
MNAPARITPAPVRKSITVKAPRDTAFRVFTANIGQWWPKSHHIGAAPLKTVRIEPFAGGRWYQVSEDGSEYDNGHVRVWQPPEHVVMTWRLNSKFQIDDTIDSEVDVRFLADGADATRVELEHRVTAVDGEAIAAAVGAPNGWTGILAVYAEAVEGG